MQSDDLRLLLAHLEEVKNSLNKSVDYLKEGLSRLSVDIDKHANTNEARYRELMAKIDSQNNLQVIQKTDHMDLKDKLKDVDKRLNSLLRLKRTMIGMTAGAGAAVALMWNQSSDFIKMMVGIFKATGKN